MRLLVIDDDELSRELLSVLLGAEGHEVEVASAGEQALALLKVSDASPPDVVLSDMQMPGTSGKALAAALRQVVGAQTRLLAMSGSRPVEAALQGFDGFLLKPFSMEDFAEALTRAGDPLDSTVVPKRGIVGDESDVPVLNEEIYGKMAKMMPVGQLGEMYAMCLADARKRLGQMAELAELGDDEGFRRAAHTVKGGCGMIGATELYDLAEVAERDGLGTKIQLTIGTSGVKALLERFSRACDRLERILGERKQENQVPAFGE